MIKNFRKFEYCPGVVANVVFKNSYSESLSLYQEFLKKHDYKMMEMTDDLFDSLRHPNFETNQKFENYDLVLIDSHKFEQPEINFTILLLEQIINLKMIIVFSSKPIRNQPLLQMKFQSLNPFEANKSTIFKTIRAQITSYINKAKNKIKEINDLLDEYDAYIESNKKKIVKVKAEKQVITKTRPPLKDAYIDLIFLSIFSIIITTASLFAFSNAKPVMYQSVINSSVAQVSSDSNEQYISATLNSSVNYTANLQLFEDYKSIEGDFVSYLSFVSPFQQSATDLEFNPILFPGETIDSEILKRFGLTFLNETGLETLPENHLPAVLSSSLLDKVFKDSVESNPVNYIGLTFSVKYNYQTIDFVVDNIILNSSERVFETYHKNTFLIFDKPIETDNSSTRLTSLIKSERSNLKSFLSRYYDNYLVTDIVEFSYVDKGESLITEAFVLNQVTTYLPAIPENYTITIVFIILLLVTSYFMLKIIISLEKTYRYCFKELAIANAISFVSIFVVFIIVVLIHFITHQSVFSFSLFNTFGFIYPSVLFLIISAIIWFVPLLELIKSKPSKD